LNLPMLEYDLYTARRVFKLPCQEGSILSLAIDFEDSQLADSL